MIRKQEATVFYSSRRNMRFFTKESAARAEATAIISECFPTEGSETDDHGRCTYAGFHWSEVERIQNIRLAMTKIILAGFNNQ